MYPIHMKLVNVYFIIIIKYVYLSPHVVLCVQYKSGHSPILFSECCSNLGTSRYYSLIAVHIWAHPDIIRVRRLSYTLSLQQKYHSRKLSLVGNGWGGLHFYNSQNSQNTFEIWVKYYGKECFTSM